MAQTNIALDIRPMQDGDSHHLLNIDLKSSEFPFDYEDWQLLAEYFPEWKIIVGTLESTPVAFAIVEFDSNDRVSRVHKIVALPRAQRIGLDSALLNSIERDSCLSGFSAVEIPVPVCQCRGGEDPYDLSQWLKQNDYVCVRTEENMFDGYGEDMDGYVFEKKCFDYPESKHGKGE